MTPTRVQLSRRKGWRKPDNTIVVARPSRWGNPYRIIRPVRVGGQWRVSGVVDTVRARTQTEAHDHAVVLFRARLQRRLAGSIHEGHEIDYIAAHLHELRGRNVACWCPLDQPCHADVLLELANA